ncbi:MAG: hypothetical protein CMA59_00400 [Euryarchaeota archaeon]|jgi:hypothetical protein|nr:hypothetical protein [Euryarchaeota archaeon]
MKSFSQYNEMVSQKQSDALKQAVIDRTQDLKLKKKKTKKEEWDAAAIEVATDYLYEMGLNEEGLDLLVEEVGLEDFVDFVLNPPEEELLMEERSARKAAASAPSYEKVKAKVDAGDKARKEAGKGEYAKTTAAKNKYGDEDNTVHDDTPAAKKPAVKKVVKKKVVSPKKKAEVSKKITKSVPVAKKKQPAKKAEKKGLLNKVSSYVKKGVERHQKAVGDAKAAYKKTRAKGKVPEKRAKEFAKGVKSGVKDTVKFAGKVKKAVVGEAKVDTGTPEEKEKARNIRKFGVSHNVAGHGKLRRALHRSDRGYKKKKGDKSQYVETESFNLEAFRVLARDKGDKGRPAQFSYKDEKDANKFADSIKSKGGKATVAKEEAYDTYKDKHLEKYGSRPGEYDRPRPSTGGGKHSGNDKMTKRKNSDKAVDNVVADLKKKYGENAVLHSKRSYVAGKRVK